ncbi:MAG: glycosyltransferase family 9 protein [Myxococcota bacterium]|nr:glycosyltransferase family 9 protein [Myxococcota bacterium]
MPLPVVHTDCRHYLGDRPCRHRRACEGCPHHDPIGARILVIKLGATGDVLRTTPLLEALRRAHPDAHITWLTRPAAAPLLAGLEALDRVLALDVETLAHLPAERFDQLICLDKEPAATGLAARIEATEKRGFLMDASGALQPAHPDSEYAFRLGLDDELKFRRNEKSYQQLCFDMAGLPFEGEDYQLRLLDGHRAAAQRRLSSAGVGKGERLIGLNVGAGDVFAYKAWRPDGFAELADRVSERLGLRCVLLAGARDEGPAREVGALGEVALVDPGRTDSLCEFAAIIERCTAVVTGDTLAMHLALAVRRPVVAIFGSTCPQEIELYGRGEKVVPKIDCHPCYKRECDRTRTCVEAIDVEQVFSALRRVLEAT